MLDVFRAIRDDEAEHAEAMELAVDLLLHHEVDPSSTDEKLADDLRDVLSLSNVSELPPPNTTANDTTTDTATAAATTAATKAEGTEASEDGSEAVRPGTGALLLAARLQVARLHQVKRNQVKDV